MGVRKHVQRNGQTTYYAVFFGPNGMRRVRRVRVVAAGASRTEHKAARIAAEKAAHDARVEVKNGTWRDDEPEAALTFADLVTRFLRDYTSRSGRPDYYQQRAKIWLATFSGKLARDVTVSDVDRLRVARLRMVSPTTVRKDLVSLSTLFRWAKARGFVESNPADPDLVRRPPRALPDPHPLTPAEVVALLDACPVWLAAIVELAVETGADRGELLRLRWDRHVDRARRLLILPRAKTGVGRWIPYGENSRIRRLLREAGAVRNPSGHVFLRDGEPVLLEAAKTAMRDAWGTVFPCRCPGRKQPHTVRGHCPTRAKPKPWKSLRATFATRMSERGVDVPTIAALMGLTTTHVLEHYVKPSGAHLAAAMADRDPAAPAVDSHLASSTASHTGTPAGLS